MRRLVANLLMLLLLTLPVLAQQSAIDSLDGIGIGTRLDEARSILARIGTGGGRDTRDGGRKEAWTLKETDFATVAFKTNGEKQIVWISAFVRQGKEIPFSRLGGSNEGHDGNEVASYLECRQPAKRLSFGGQGRGRESECGVSAFPRVSGNPVAPERSICYSPHRRSSGSDRENRESICRPGSHSLSS